MVKINAVSCPRRSYIQMRETDGRQKQTSKQKRQFVIIGIKKISVREHLILEVEESTVMQVCSWGKEKSIQSPLLALVVPNIPL